MLISLLITILVIGLLFYVLSLMPIPQPWMNVARAVLCIIAIIYLLSYVGAPYWNHRLP